MLKHIAATSASARLFVRSMLFVLCFSCARLCASPAMVSTIAGSGTAASIDGTGLAASFNYPIGAAYDKCRGVLYVSDYSSGRIRRVSTSSTVVVDTLTTGFSIPWGLAVSADCNYLYVADYGGGGIAKVSLPSGAWTVLISGISSPFGVDATTAGNVAVVHGSGSIGLVNSNTGAYTLVKTLSTSLYGVASDPQGVLYVAENGGHCIRRIVPSTGVVTNLAGQCGTSGCVDGVGTVARLTNPAGIQFLNDGTLIVTEEFGSRVLTVTLAGVVMTIAGQCRITGHVDGNGTNARFGYLYSVSVDRTLGVLYLPEYSNHRLRLISGISQSTKSASLTEPRSVSTSASAVRSVSLSPSVSSAGSATPSISSTTDRSVEQSTSSTPSESKSHVTVLSSCDQTSTASNTHSPPLTKSRTSKTSFSATVSSSRNSHDSVTHSCSFTTTPLQSVTMTRTGTATVSLSPSRTASNTMTSSLSRSSTTSNLKSATDSVVSTPSVSRAAVVVDALPSIVVAAEVTASVASTASVLSATMSGGAGNAGTFAALGLMGCSPPSMRASAGALRFLLSPFVDYGGAAMVLGNVGIVVCVALAQVSVIAAVVAASPVMRSQAEVAAFARFPHYTFVASVLGVQGIGCGFVMAAVDAANGSAVGLAATAIVVAPVAVGVFVLAVYRTVLTCNANTEYVLQIETCTSGVRRWLRVLLLPRGRWMPAHVRQRFGFAFDSAHGPPNSQTPLVYTLHGFVFVVLSRVPMGSCAAQCGLLAMWMLASCCAVAVRRPFRCHVDNALISAGQATMVGMLVVLAVSASGAMVDNRDAALAALSMLQSIVMVLKAVYAVAVVVIERRGSNPQETVFSNGDRQTNRWTCGDVLNVLLGAYLMPNAQTDSADDCQHDALEKNHQGTTLSLVSTPSYVIAHENAEVQSHQPSEVFLHLHEVSDDLVTSEVEIAFWDSDGAARVSLSDFEMEEMEALQMLPATRFPDSKYLLTLT